MPKASITSASEKNGLSRVLSIRLGIEYFMDLVSEAKEKNCSKSDILAYRLSFYDNRNRIKKDNIIEPAQSKLALSDKSAEIEQKKSEIKSLKAELRKVRKELEKSKVNLAIEKETKIDAKVKDYGYEIGREYSLKRSNNKWRLSSILEARDGEGIELLFRNETLNKGRRYVSLSDAKNTIKW